MNQLSALFHEKIDPLLQADKKNLGSTSLEPVTRQPRYRQALLNNLLLQTSCFRYWGQGVWTDYARELYQQGERLLQTTF